MFDILGIRFLSGKKYISQAQNCEKGASALDTRCLLSGERTLPSAGIVEQVDQQNNQKRFFPISLFKKWRNPALCCPSKILQKHCFQFLLERL